MTHPLVQQIYDACMIALQRGIEPRRVEVSNLRFDQLNKILHDGKDTALRREYLERGTFLGLKLKIVKGRGMAVSGRRKKST